MNAVGLTVGLAVLGAVATFYWSRRLDSNAKRRTTHYTLGQHPTQQRPRNVARSGGLLLKVLRAPQCVQFTLVGEYMVFYCCLQPVTTNKQPSSVSVPLTHWTETCVEHFTIRLLLLAELCSLLRFDGDITGRLRRALLDTLRLCSSKQEEIELRRIQSFFYSQ